ncbi:hypothetical protein [Paraburkholderia atlantica]|uniref:hypothetical protein n=1 Tax=Paraburkholderia atlantica TaxID=2654982 RepID=UPI003D209981
MNGLSPFNTFNSVSALLPSEARMALVRAANEAKQLKDELAREIHIANAIRRVRLNYPEFFKD